MKTGKKAVMMIWTAAAMAMLAGSSNIKKVQVVSLPERVIQL